MLPTHLPSEWGRRQLSLANKIAALSSKIVRNTLSNSSQNNEDDDGLLISTKNFGYVRFGEDDDCVARGDIKAIGKFVIGRFIVRKFETSLPFPLLNAVLYGNEGVQRKMSWVGTRKPDMGHCLFCHWLAFARIRNLSYIYLFERHPLSLSIIIS